MRNIIIVEPGSTGYNYVEDIVRRGYNPVVLEAWKDVPPEILALFKDEIEKPGQISWQLCIISPCGCPPIPPSTCLP